MAKEKYYARKVKGIQKNIWFPFDTERILRETVNQTGMTQREIILKGIDLVAAQTQQVAA